MAIRCDGQLPQSLRRDLIVNSKDSEYVHCYRETARAHYVPLHFGGARSLGEPPDMDPDNAAKFVFAAELRPKQQEIARAVLDLLNDTNCALIAAHTGFGKTITSLYLLSKIRLKTFIVTNMIDLMSQWEKPISDFLPGARAQIVGAGQKINKNNDIFIINVANISKISGALDWVGVLLIDEVHLILSPRGAPALLHFTPNYLIGLSATPYRHDGSNALFDLFFGASVLYIPLYHPHTVFTIYTEFMPSMTKNLRGGVDWDKVLKEQAADVARNTLIVDIVVNHPEHVFLILCKLISHVDTLVAMLIARGLLADEIQAAYGKGKITARAGKRALIGIVRKVGVGFDDPSLTALIVASDIKQYFVQNMGRVFRDPKCKPVIFDLVDARCHPLHEHFKVRAKEYKSAGGEIK